MALKSGVVATAQTTMINVVILSLNFGTGIITARTLGPDGRGSQAAMQMWPQIFATALTLGLPFALLYNLGRHPERGSQFFSAALLMGTGVGFLATLAGMTFIPYWLTEYSPEAVRTAQWFMLFAPIILFIEVFNSTMRARQEFTAYNTGRFLLPALTMLVLVLLTLTGRLTPANAALAYLLPFVPIFLWLAIRLWRTYRPRLQDLRTSLHSLASYGIRSYGIDVLGQLVAGRLDRILVVGLLSPAAMGLYVVAFSLARTIDVFPSALAQVVLPKAASRSVEEVVTLVGWGVRVSTSITVIAASALMLLGPWVLELVYGQEFVDAVPVFRVLLADVVLDGATWVLAQAFIACNRPGVVSITQSIGVSLTVPLLLVMVPTYGLLGAGLSLLISTAVRFVFMLASFPLSLRVRPPRLWPRWSDYTSIVRGRGDD